MNQRPPPTPQEKARVDEDRRLLLLALTDLRIAADDDRPDVRTILSGYADALARVLDHSTALEERVEALTRALERIASLKPRPVLDPYNCEERLKRIARDALSTEGSGPE